MNRLKTEQEVSTLPTVGDKLFLTCLLVAGVTGMQFALNNVGYLLGFNASTLWIAALFFSIFSWKWIKRDRPTSEQLPYISLAIIPITLRTTMNTHLFTEAIASQTRLTNLGYLIQVLGLWNLVAVSEEAFRATMYTAASELIPDHWEWNQQLVHESTTAKMLLANTAWVAFHFLQRPLDLSLYWRYILWLYLTGFVFTVIMKHGGLGAATIAHIIVNLTA